MMRGHSIVFQNLGVPCRASEDIVATGIDHQDMYIVKSMIKHLQDML